MGPFTAVTLDTNIREPPTGPIAVKKSPPQLKAYTFIGSPGAKIERGMPVDVRIVVEGDQVKMCDKTALVVAVDVSGSLGDIHQYIVDALMYYLHLFNLGTDTVAVGSFAGSWKDLTDGWTTNKNEIEKAFGALTSGGDTDIQETLSETNKLLGSLPANYDCRSALVITDGTITEGGAANIPTLMGDAKKNGWNYWFLGVGDQNVNNLSFFAAASGGTYIDPTVSAPGTSEKTAIGQAIWSIITGAMKIVAPSNIVITETVNPSLTVIPDSATPPKVPPNQLDAQMYLVQAKKAWKGLETSSKTATLPPIDRLDCDVYGAPREYSLEFQATVDTCDKVKPPGKDYPINAVGLSTATYTVEGYGPQSTNIQNNVLTVMPCGIEVLKSWNSTDGTVDMTIRHSFSHSVSEIVLTEVFNDPVVIESTSIPSRNPSLGERWAIFDVPDLSPKDSDFTVKIGITLPPTVGHTDAKLQVNDLTDSNLSFVVPHFALSAEQGSPEYVELQLDIEKHSVGAKTRLFLHKAAQELPHTEDMIPAIKAWIIPNISTLWTGTAWPEFDYYVMTDDGMFLFVEHDLSYDVYVASEKYLELDPLLVDVREL